MSTNERSLLRKLESGEMLKLAPLFAVPKEAYEALPFYEKRWLRGIACGRSSTSAVVVGKSAARVHTMWGIARAEEPTELALPGGGVLPPRQQLPNTLYRRSALSEEELIQGDHVRVTTKARTVIDIARWHGFDDGVVAADWFLKQGGTKEEMRRELGRLGPVKNKGIVRKVIEAAVPNSQSPYESLLRAAIVREDIPILGAQYEIAGFHVDIGLTLLNGVEVDGDEKYDETFGSPPELVITQERAREKKIQNAGMRLLRFRPKEIVDSPEKVVAEVRAALSREKELGGRAG
ncbi:hypothetical protein [Corynebacterium sp.]|uniref:hypothetical protein n=1 Tax=Corynebacterium sp. TaxID=1720 RepID=UPI00373636F5